MDQGPVSRRSGREVRVRKEPGVRLGREVGAGRRGRWRRSAAPSPNSAKTRVAPPGAPSPGSSGWGNRCALNGSQRMRPRAPQDARGRRLSVRRRRRARGSRRAPTPKPGPAPRWCMPPAPASTQPKSTDASLGDYRPSGCYFFSTMSAFKGPTAARTSACSFAGTLNLAMVAFRCFTITSQSPSVIFSPAWAVFMSRP